MITSSSTVIASSLAVMVEENRDSLEPAGGEEDGEQTCSSKVPKLPGYGLLGFPGLYHPPQLPSLLAAHGCTFLPAPAWPKNILTVCIDQKVSEVGLISLFFPLLLALTLLSSEQFCRATYKSRVKKTPHGINHKLQWWQGIPVCEHNTTWLWSWAAPWQDVRLDVTLDVRLLLPQISPAHSTEMSLLLRIMEG